MEKLLFFGVGITLFVGLGALRQSGKQWAAVYWILFGVLGLQIALESRYLYLGLIAMPIGIRILSLQYFAKSIHYKYLTNLLPSLVILPICFELTEIGHWVLLGLLLLECFVTIRLILGLFKEKDLLWTSSAGRKYDWFKWFFLANALLMVVTLLFVFDSGISPWALLVCYLFVSCLAVLKYAGESSAYDPIIGENKYVKSTLDQTEKYKILQGIEQQIFRHKFHQNSNASLANLSKSIGFSSHQVSQVINESKGMSFFELLAYHRVQDAKKLLRSEKFQHYKIEQIAEEVGYLSKSAFNTSFKKFTGKTPSEFKENNVRDDKVERRDHREIAAYSGTTSTFGDVLKSTVMFSNFLKVYFRNLSRNKIFAFINLSGLVIGFTSCLLIYLYLSDELSYDKFHEGSENIYRITLETSNPQTRTPHPMAQALVKDFPEVESAVTLTPLYGPGLTLQKVYVINPENNVMYQIPDGFAADSTFFDVFDFELVAGNEKTALKNPGSVVISEYMAKLFFGDEDPMGKSLEGADGQASLVTGIMKDAPSNSHFHPKFIIPYTSLKADPGTERWMSWSDAGHFNYIRLKDGADANKLQATIPEWIVKYADGLEPELLQFIKDGVVYFGLQPIEDIHLRSTLKWELEANSSITYVYILFASVLFILTILAVNFINLYTARTYERAKEVGIRKTIGATRQTISIQFISEALVTCVIAMLMSVGIAILILGNFNALANKTYEWSLLIRVDVMLFAIGLVVVIGLISGLFPSLTISSIKPVEILKGKFVNQTRGTWKRTVLIGLQFTVSAAMIFGSVVILNQVKFLESQALGFQEDYMAVMQMHTEDESNSAEAIKSEIEKIPGVSGVAGISNLPGGQFNQNDLFLEDEPFERFGASELWVDFDALQLLGLELADGRWFDRSSQKDSAGTNFIINETAARQLNLTGTNQNIMWNWETGAQRGTVVGIVKDFHFKSLHEPIKPLVATVGLSSMNYLMIRVNAANLSATLEEIEKVHQRFDDRFAANITFLDDQINKLYDSERRAFQIFNLFALIALLLASMGLLGIAYLVITQRTREIGVRKVLGATLSDLLWMENKTFIRIVLVSLIFGIPLAILIMRQWLQEFAYHVSIGFSPYVITIIVLALVSVLSVSLAVLKTVLSNPSKALRYE